YNRRLAQWRVTWLIEHSTSHQLLWCIDSFELRNPPLRQAPKRCVPCKMKRLTYILTCFLFLGFQVETNRPTSEFVSIVKKMETENWIHDHDRLTKVSIYSEIDRKSKKQFE